MTPDILWNEKLTHTHARPCPVSESLRNLQSREPSGGRAEAYWSRVDILGQPSFALCDRPCAKVPAVARSEMALAEYDFQNDIHVAPSPMEGAKR